MKSKLLLAMAAITVCAMLVIGGTLAYFTAQETTENIFTVGNITADLTETNWSGIGTNQNGGSSVSSAPEGGWGVDNATRIVPGRVIAKNPQITIMKNSEDCYARLVVTMPTVLYTASNLEQVSGTDTTPTYVTFATMNTDWGTPSVTPSGSNTILTYKYKTGTKIERNTSDNQDLGELFQTITIAGTASNTQISDLGSFTVIVKAQVVQAETFEASATQTAEEVAFDAAF